MENTGKLAGRTIFISGASRGIGKAIALKCARDGANVVIAAKTAEPHPKLPGTIYTAAEEIEAAGGKCLPCIVDIRYEDQVQSAVEQAVQKFGGIDVLVNNASAISLTGTLETPMKRYDLMNGINARGTYLVSQKCLPYLKVGKNPHILNISPPLNMQPHWFKGHVAYTMAKYGMSMCVLGMAEEFKPDRIGVNAIWPLTAYTMAKYGMSMCVLGMAEEFKAEGIAVNALWPLTAISTAAMDMLAGVDAQKQCRKPDIMADAAYVMVTRDSGSYTGNFAIDEDVLKEEGIQDLDQYACVPGHPLMPDFFLDITAEELNKNLKIPQAAAGGASQAAAGGPAQTFEVINSLVSEDILSSVKGVFQFNLTGVEEGTWHLNLKDAPGGGGAGEPAGKPDVTMTMTSEDFVKMFAGEMQPTQAFMSGKLRIKGDLAMAIKLEKLMGKMKSKL
ncbi:HSDL2 [Branchiostoma lanceolatum]|uniref:Hydroxysteroid dehydrogenase-like protein 2 n=1 Tax=Branchiostoma lanceolatum TaxID=7740 RepID=A0A8J9YYV8_BRALA|nr:HSDL2 [Branchiostoma lanceolatum]